jgi:hypothetical protein
MAVSRPGNDGWQWLREIYLSNSTVWNYDLASNTWRERRPLPAPRVGPLRCASWDSDHQVVVIFGGEGVNDGTVAYDPYSNSWTRRSPAQQPAPRSSGNMTYDEARRLHVLFGSQFSDDPHTWTYDLRKNEWRDRKPATQPPTDRNDAVLAYDPVNKVIVASVRVIDKAEGKEVVDGHYETWAYDAGRNVWKAMKPPREPEGWGNRRRIMVAVPDLNVVLMENYINPSQRVPGVDREQQIWTYRYAATPKAARLPPSAVRVITSARAATVSWERSPSEGVTGYAVYRGTGANPWLVDYQQVGEVDSEASRFEDRDLKPGVLSFYCVRSLTKDDKESRDSMKARTQPRVVEDVVVSVLSPTEVRLSWPASAGRDVVGYHVERAPVEVFSDDEMLRLKKDTPPLTDPSVGAIKAIGSFRRLTDRPLKEAAFRDVLLDLRKSHSAGEKPLFAHRFTADRLDAKGKPVRYAVFAYRVYAVNALGVESGPSAYFLTIPSATSWLFAREEEEKCHLKWMANPEQRLQGYRVYRMEGPKINGPGQKVTRLTADPLKEPRFTDATAGKDTRRYWVVAVDALGQEGIPSAPAWHYRQFRRYYVPFVGAWHQ